MHYLTYQASIRARGRDRIVAREYEGLFGPYHGGMIDTYRLDDAEVALVAMDRWSAPCERQSDDCDGANGSDWFKIRSYRPFPTQALRDAVADIPAIVVWTKRCRRGFQGVLSTDVKAALYNAPRRPMVLSMMAGYGGREMTLDTVDEIVARHSKPSSKVRVEDECVFLNLRERDSSRRCIA